MTITATTVFLIQFGIFSYYKIGFYHKNGIILHPIYIE